MVNQDYSIYSIDASLAFIGGYTALFWQIASILVGSYQAYSYESDLINKLFTVDKSNGRKPETLSSRDEVEALVTNRAPYNYSYKEYLLTKLMKIFCFCCKSADFYKRRIKY